MSTPPRLPQDEGNWRISSEFTDPSLLENTSPADTPETTANGATKALYIYLVIIGLLIGLAVGIGLAGYIYFSLTPIPGT